MEKTKLSVRQTIAWDALHDDTIEDVMYGGAKGGGKSVFLVTWAYSRAKEIISQFNLKPMKYPIPVGFLGRKRGVDFGDTTLETWKKMVPQDLYRIRDQDKEIIIDETVKICFGGLDDEKNVKKFNSAEFAFIGIDQAEELLRDDLALLKGTLRLIIQGKAVTPKVLLTANPAPCFLKDDYILTPIAKSRFIRALPADNPFIDRVAYIARLREAFKHRPELVRAYVEGSWDDIEGSDLIIQYSWVLNAVNRNIIRNSDKRLIVCDVGRFGDDETVIYAFENEKVVDAVTYVHRSTMETAGHCVAMKKKHDSDMIVIDSVGVGGGVVDRLVELKENVFPLNSGEKSDLPEKYLNIRAQMWWEAGQMFYSGVPSIPDDPILKGQLSSVKYKFASGGQIQIESREDIKKRLGNSGDRAVTVVMGLYALKFCKEHEVKSDWRTSYKSRQRQGSAMAA